LRSKKKSALGREGCTEEEKRVQREKENKHAPPCLFLATKLGQNSGDHHYVHCLFEKQ
jgi:hypothetical protein